MYQNSHSFCQNITWNLCRWICLQGLKPLSHVIHSHTTHSIEGNSNTVLHFLFQNTTLIACTKAPPLNLNTSKSVYAYHYKKVSGVLCSGLKRNPCLKISLGSKWRTFTTQCHLRVPLCACFLLTFLLFNNIVILPCCFQLRDSVLECLC